MVAVLSVTMCVSVWNVWLLDLSAVQCGGSAGRPGPASSLCLDAGYKWKSAAAGTQGRTQEEDSTDH